MNRHHGVKWINLFERAKFQTELVKGLRPAGKIRLQQVVTKVVIHTEATGKELKFCV